MQVPSKNIMTNLINFNIFWYRQSLFHIFIPVLNLTVGSTLVKVKSGNN